MTGLIERIGALRGGFDISAGLAAQAGALGDLAALVRSLAQDGPPELSALTGAVGALPLPPEVTALARLAADLPGALAAAPADPSALVGPLIAPLRTLAEGGFSISVSIDIGALMELVREVIRLTTGRVFAGPQGMPDGPGPGPSAFPMPDAPGIDELRASVTAARATLAALGPRLDAPRLLGMLQQAGAGLGGRHPRLPPIPVLGDMLEALGTIAAWQTMAPEALARSLAASLHDAAKLIAMPRDRAVTPLIEAATTARDAAAAFAAAADSLGAVLPGLAARLATGLGTPTASEATALERAAELIEPVLAALHPEASPLAAVDRLPFELTGHLLRAQRALSGAGDAGALLARAQALVAAIPPPAAGTSPFAEARAAIDALDLAAITAPIGALRDAVGEALEGVAAARAGVRDALAAAIAPLADGLDTVLDAARIEDAVPAIAGFAGELTTLLDTEVRPAVGAVRGAIEEAIEAIDAATTAFDPAVLIAPIRAALDDLAALLEDPAIQEPFARISAALEQAVAAIEGFDLAGAADEAIRNLEKIEQTLAAIDPSLIPEDAGPLIDQAVSVVTEIDFTETVARPVAAVVSEALEAGPAALLGAMEEGTEALRRELETFRPSAAIGAEIGEPFQELAATLRGFRPSALLAKVQEALDAIAAQIGVLDIGAVLDPLRDGHRRVAEAVALVEPARLLAPVQAEADRAVARLLSETRLDAAFAGLAEFARAVEAPLALLADLRDVLGEAAGLLADPGDARAEVDALLEAALARLDTVAMAELADGFAATAGAVAAIQRDALVAPLAPALRGAAAAIPEAFGTPAGRLARALATLPVEALERARDTPATRRARAAARRLAAAAANLATLRGSTPALAQRLGVQAGELEAKLADYQRLLVTEGGGAFAGLAGPPPADTTALKAAVRAALQEEVAAPLRVLHAAFAALAPWAAALSRGVAEILEAARARLDGILGEGGLGGAAADLAALGAELTDLDLDEIIAPIGALHARLAGAVAALDPAPIAAALTQAQAAITGLLRVEILLPPATLRDADAAWAAVVARIEALSPEQVIAATLDPAYERALGALAPALELPVRLRALVDAAGGTIGEDALAHLARVEAAFDRMLRAIPRGTGRPGASGSVSGSVSVAA